MPSVTRPLNVLVKQGAAATPSDLLKIRNFMLPLGKIPLQLSIQASPMLMLLTLRS